MRSADLNRRTVFLTGASGFLGRYLVTSLVSAGHRIFALSRSLREATENPGVCWVQGDLLSSELDPLLRDADAVVHAAGVMGQTETAERSSVNLEGTCRLLEAAGRQGVRRFIHVSTCTADSKSENSYARSKGLGEKAVTESSCDWTVLRPTEIYGLGSRWFGHMAGALAGRRLVFVCRDLGEITPVHVADVASVAVHSLSTPTAYSKIYTLAGPSMGLVEFYEGVRDAIGGRYRVVGLTQRQIRFLIAVSKPLPGLNRRVRGLLATAEARAVTLDSGSATTDLGFNPRRFPGT